MEFQIRFDRGNGSPFAIVYGISPNKCDFSGIVLVGNAPDEFGRIQKIMVYVTMIVVHANKIIGSSKQGMNRHLRIKNGDFCQMFLPNGHECKIWRNTSIHKLDLLKTLWKFSDYTGYK